MRQSVAVLVILATASAFAQDAIPPDSQLRRGLASYRSADYLSAVADLQAATQGFLAPEQVQAYVDTGTFSGLQSFETSLVYLALAQFRLGREDDARETLLRLQSAERIAPAYQNLQLGTDAREVESLAAALLPSSPLPHNLQIASDDDRPSALPPVEKKREEKRGGAKKTLAEQKAERRQVIDEIVGDARIALERQTIEKATAERMAASQREADQQIATANADAQKQIDQLRSDAEQRVASAEAEAKQRVVNAQAQSSEQVAAARRDAEQRAAVAEADAKKAADVRVAELQKLTAQRISDDRAAADRAASARVAETDASAHREYLLVLRTAEAAGSKGNVPEAARLYAGLVNATSVPREVLAEAAVGLYRTGAFREAADAFRKFGTFAKGEEDLRYYNAVVLYETGQYVEAQKELACALPFIQLTADVARYRTKIESTR